MFILLTKIRSRFSDSSGVTLIELMVSLFVFAIGMLALSAMCLISIQGNSLVNRTTQANYLAQSRMEELLTLKIAQLDALKGAPTVNIDGVGDAGTNYSREITIYNSAVNTRWVTVNVSWVDSKGAHQVELKSLAREQ